jgi:hypothetical protein
MSLLELKVLNKYWRVALLAPLVAAPIWLVNMFLDAWPPAADPLVSSKLHPTAQ